jgi:hypothetical protein
MDDKVHEIMCCILCYNSLLDVSSLITTQARKWIISYYKINVIITLVNVDIVLFLKRTQV